MLVVQTAHQPTNAVIADAAHREIACCGVTGLPATEVSALMADCKNETEFRATIDALAQIDAKKCDGACWRFAQNLAA